MKIKFKILWFEDTQSWIKGKSNDMREIVEDEFFEWVEPDIHKNESSFKGDFNDYDLILMDYALTEGKHRKTGADIIEKIRKKDIYTNILFYSRHGEDELREEISKRKIDGVFCAHRADFIDEFETLFKTIIKKTQDINNLRGLVMAETSDIDSLKEEIIGLYDQTSCEKKKKITKKILKNMKDTIEKNLRFLQEKNDNTPFKELIELFDLSKKSIIVHNINKRGKPTCGYTHKDFNKSVILKRNLLAHVKEKTIDKGKDKKIVLESKKGKLIFSDSEARIIRSDLSKYKKELEKIKESLMPK